MSATTSSEGLWRFAAIGVLAGFFSGLFGVGGGIVIVPLLMVIAGFDQRLANGTSLSAILPTAIAGATGYIIRGDVDWLAALCLATGAVVGALIGSWLLHRIPVRALRWIFIGFLLAMAMRMFAFVPDRGEQLEWDALLSAALLGLGVITGTLSGMLGVGGGVIVVPILMVAFGMGDLVAKGTSLLMMIPTSFTGTVANARRGNTNIRAAAALGLTAVPGSLGGVALSGAVPARVGAILFAILLTVTATQLAGRAIRQRQ